MQADNRTNWLIAIALIGGLLWLLAPVLTPFVASALLAYIGDQPVIGAPGCARSPKENIVDLLLPRLLAGDRLTISDIIALGHGGLLEDVPERPLPRNQIR